MSVTFIGDVHGWKRRLARVIEQAEGRLVFMGDLVDRGPDAPAVLDKVHALCDAGRAACLLGNHEWMLVRSLGRGDADPSPGAFAAWLDGWGGDAVISAYGVSDAAALKRALRPHWAWLCSLPWLLEGSEEGRSWVAVHAGLDPRRPTRAQLDELRLGWDGPWGDGPDPRPQPLFRKHDVSAVPSDFPAGTVLVSGHTPQAEAFVSSRRILCDTTGGLPGRRLTGVVFPASRVVTGTDA